MIEINEPYQILLGKLRAANTVFVTGDDQEIKGAGHALAATIEFLDKLDVPPELWAPLLKLNIAIDDHLRGKPNPMLVNVASPPHRPPELIDQELIKGLAAAAMTLFMEGEETKEEAGRKVARGIEHWGKPARDLTPHAASIGEAGKAIAGWRDRIKKGNPETDHASSIYYMALSQVRDAGVTSRQKAEAILNGGPPHWLNSPSPK